MEEAFEIDGCTIMQEDTVHSCYKKLPDKYTNNKFGEPLKNRESVSRVKKILTWINHEPVTLVNRRQADFIKRTRSFVGQVKDLESSRLYANILHSRKSVKDEFSATDILHIDLNKQALFWWQCLQDLNDFRRKLKKRIPEVPILDIEDEFTSLDKKHVGVLPEDEVFLIFDKYRIYPNKKFLVPLMDILQLRKAGTVNYRELLNLLNWKRSLPVLPTIKQTSAASPDCTTYNDNIGNVQTTDSAKIRAAGLPSERSDFLITRLPRAGIYPDKENLGDQTSVYCLISPSIRDKREIRSIFEIIGFEFPECSFDTLWQKGIRKDCTDGVCVETSQKLLAVSGFVAKKITCR